MITYEAAEGRLLAEFGLGIEILETILLIHMSEK